MASLRQMCREWPVISLSDELMPEDSNIPMSRVDVRVA